MPSPLQLNMYQNTDVRQLHLIWKGRNGGICSREKEVLTFCLQEVKDINYPEVGLFNSILNASHLKTRAYAHT